MNGIQECKTLKMSWAEASRLIGKRLDEILGHPIDCATSPDAYDYWSTGFLGYRMPLSELHFLLETMHLDDSEALDSLLMHKREIIKLASLSAQKGFSLIPLSLYFKDSRVKVELGLCRGKKLYDKRETDAKNEARREMERAEKSSREKW